MITETITAPQLREKIELRKAQIALIGLGYVGLPMGLEFARAGFQVTGIDIDENKVDRLNNGESYILDVKNDAISQLARRFHASSSYENLTRADVIIICVPTPLRKTKEPDLTYILAAAKEIKKYLHPGQLVLLESTTYPGTTDEIIVPELEGTGLKAGVDFFVGFSPERIDPGNAYYHINNTPKIVGGYSPACAELSELVYQSIVERVIRVSSTRSAEMVKLLENTFRAINIGMVNEVAIMCDKLGIDTWEVIDAAATKPFGYMPFYPGPGLGGHCIPIDPHYLSWKLKMLNYSARFIELASEINSSMPCYVVSKIADALNQEEKSVKGSKILVLGVAYKKDSNDIRESPALDIIRLLHQKQASVLYHDPHIRSIATDSLLLSSEELTSDLLREADCAVIVTDHSAFEWQFVVDHSALILDTRNATRHTRPGGCRIVKL
jgi:UDP-N-acetyl-D-glucosamine dehydrogenase